MFLYFKKQKWLGLTFLLILFSVGFLLFPQIARAGLGNTVFSILAFILFPIIYFLSRLLLLVIRLITAVAPYNDFTNSPVVTQGWGIVRDLSNMFFLVMMLVIAFSTVLKIEKYSYKRHLATLLIMAVLINFSRMICGLLIDAGQIVMMTFVSVIRGTIEGNMAEMLGIGEVLRLRSLTKDIEVGEVVATLLYALALVLIALVVCVVYLIILVFRIIILWILVTISPFAFICQVLPGMQKYASQWWEKFTHQIIIGPVMAFFLWLALATNQWPSPNQPSPTLEHFLNSLPKEQKDLIEGRLGALTGRGVQLGSELSASLSEMGKPNRLMSFSITIAMLIGGLMAAQQLGVAGSRIAGQALGKIQAYATGAAKFPWKGIAKPALTSIGERLSAATGIPLLPSLWKEGWKRARERRREERLAEMWGKGKIFGSPEEFFYQFMRLKHGFGVGGVISAGRLEWLKHKYKKEGKSIEELKERLSPAELAILEKNEKHKKEMETILAYEDQINKKGEIQTIITDKSTRAVLENVVTDLEGQLKLDIPPETKAKIQAQINEINKMLQDKTVKTVNIKADWIHFKESFKNQLASYKTTVKSSLETLGEEIKKSKNLSALDKHLQKLEKYEKGIKNLRHLTPLSSRMAYANLVAEEERKLANIEDPQELNRYLEDAFRMKDKIRVMAIMRKMAKDGNDNEFLNYFNYASDAEGMHKFINDKLIKELGMSKQEAYEFETDLGYVNEKVNHWQTSRLTMTDEITGEIRQATKDEHLAMVTAEMKKRNPRDIIRNYNRLAYGGEIEVTLPDGSKKRIFHLTDEGAAILKDLEGVIADYIGELNINAAQKLAELEETTGELTKRGFKKEVIEKIKARARGESAKAGGKESRPSGPSPFKIFVK